VKLPIGDICRQIAIKLSEYLVVVESDLKSKHFFPTCYQSIQAQHNFFCPMSSIDGKLLNISPKTVRGWWG
jgi:hypothetical protein